MGVSKEDSCGTVGNVLCGSSRWNPWSPTILYGDEKMRRVRVKFVAWNEDKTVEIVEDDSADFEVLPVKQGEELRVKAVRENADFKVRVIRNAKTPQSSSKHTPGLYTPSSGMSKLLCTYLHRDLSQIVIFRTLEKA